MENWGRMPMGNKLVGRYNFVSEEFHNDFTHHLFWGELGQEMLNASDYHSNEHGLGMDYMNSIHRTWVLSRLAIEMEDMPVVNRKYTIETWVESILRSFICRNFAIIDSLSHQVYGYARSIWAVIDTQTRQPVDLSSIKDGSILQYVNREKTCPIAKTSRVQVGADAVKVRTVNTYYSDVDINGHINSIRYIDHILDLFDLDYYRNNTLKRFEIAYVAESHQGDKLNFYREDEGNGVYAFKVTKTEPQSSKEVEVVRSKAIFIKK